MRNGLRCCGTWPKPGYRSGRSVMQLRCLISGSTSSSRAQELTNRFAMGPLIRAGPGRVGPDNPSRQELVDRFRDVVLAVGRLSPSTAGVTCDHDRNDA